MAATVMLQNGLIHSDFRHLIDGELVGSETRFEVLNPATEQVIAHVPRATRSDLDRAVAVAAARRAQAPWGALSFDRRREYVARISEALQANQDALAEVLTREQGKPLQQSRDEITRAATQAEGMAAISIRDEVLIEDASRHVELRYTPIGVVGVIAPWNAPINLAAGPLVMALYTGNTVVLKPSPYAPLSTLKMGELLRGLLPAGVVNVLAGGDDCGQWMSEHPGVDKISFTGSVATGKKVMASAAGNLKRVTLELGGNDAAIVLEDVDVRAVAPKLFFAAFVNSGQVCMAIKRIYAHERIYEALCQALEEQARKARIGDGMNAETQYGPIQNRMQYERVLGILEDTRRRGGRFLSGGVVAQGEGYFLGPTIVADLPDDSRLVQEEQFGPIVPVLKFTDIDDAVRRANDTRYGLAGSVWGRDIERAVGIAIRLEVGTAWVNQHRATAATVPFGGVKESGIGRNYSEIGLKSYMEPKVLSIFKS